MTHTKNSINSLKLKDDLRIFTHSILPQTQQPIIITKINWLMLFTEIITVYSENHKQLINKLHGQNNYSLLKQVVHTVTTRL
jgi:hypothetical protein